MKNDVLITILYTTKGLLLLAMMQNYIRQIRSMIIEYNFFMASMYFRQSVRRLACII